MGVADEYQRSYRVKCHCWEITASLAVVKNIFLEKETISNFGVYLENSWDIYYKFRLEV